MKRGKGGGTREQGEGMLLWVVNRAISGLLPLQNRKEGGASKGRSMGRWTGAKKLDSR